MIEYSDRDGGGPMLTGEKVPAIAEHVLDHHHDAREVGVWDNVTAIAMAAS